MVFLYHPVSKNIVYLSPQESLCLAQGGINKWRRLLGMGYNKFNVFGIWCPYATYNFLLMSSMQNYSLYHGLIGILSYLLNKTGTFDEWINRTWQHLYYFSLLFSFVSSFVIFNDIFSVDFIFTLAAFDSR